MGQRLKGNISARAPCWFTRHLIVHPKASKPGFGEIKTYHGAWRTIFVRKDDVVTLR
jgi:hypothetical protein